MTDISHDCGWLRKNIEAFLDDELSNDAKERFENHAATCRTCRAEVEQAQRILTQLRQLPALECPDDVVERVRETALPDDGPNRIREWFARAWAPSLRPALATITVAAIVLTSIWVGRVNRTTISPEEVSEAQAALKWTLAYVGEVSERSGKAVRDEAIRNGLIRPVQRALESIHQGSDVEPETNGG